MHQLADLFDQAQRQSIKDAPLWMGARHPTWYPLFHDKPRALDVLVNEAFRRVRHVGGDVWLKALVPSLLDFKSINNASSALAELRAYGGLLEAGFTVTPIPRKSSATPDFTVDAGDGPITVEVFSKHQDKQQDDLLNAVHSTGAALPAEVERRTRQMGSTTITTTVTVLNPGGVPNPSKPHDSVQANVISRVCGIKQDESQVPDDRPAILIADFGHFGGPVGAEFLKPDQAAPVESGHHGITCGAIWYALYGWKGAPIFEEGSHRLVPMGHDGRFRLAGPKKSKLSAVLAVFAEGAVLLENPWATRQLTEQSRWSLVKFPWFNVARSIAAWHTGDCAAQVDQQRRMIEAMERNSTRMQW